MGCGLSSSLPNTGSSFQSEEKYPLVQLLDSHGRQWVGPAAGIFFEHDPAPAVVAHCASLGVEFEDPDFNPNGSLPNALADHLSPLSHRSAHTESQGKVFFDGTVAGGMWLRHRDIPRDEGVDLKLFDRLSVTDVIQGGIGNCWLCAVICAAIKHASDVVASSISPPTANAVGCYSVRFWVEGRPLFIPVDDRIYCSDGVPFDMHSDQRHEMYVSLIAKAITKWLFWYDLNGDEGDDNRTIDEGMVLYCLRAITGSGDLTGQLLKWQTPSPPKRLFRKSGKLPVDVVPASSAVPILRDIFARGCAATCGGAEENMGLVDTHAYTVLWYGVVAGVELVQLRNPHGGGGGGPRDYEEGEWQGAWSDNDQMWEERPGVKAAIVSMCNAGVSVAGTPYWNDDFSHDGIFFMSFDDFVSHFQHVEYVQLPFGGVTQATQAALEAAHRGKPSNRWRIRSTKQSVIRWDVSNLKFFAADGTELLPRSAIESASAADAVYDNNPGWDAHSMLFGHDGAPREDFCWGGRCPDDDILGAWVGGVFDPPVTVANVHCKQDDFTEVLLEQYVAETGTWITAQLLTGLELVEAY